jgi:hypothetical protein
MHGDPGRFRDAPDMAGMKQGNLFDAQASQEAKEHGMEVAAMNRAELLEEVRELARSIATGRPEGTCDMDLLVDRMLRRGLKPEALGNAAGSVFMGREWEFTGRRKRSARVSRHANEIKVWRYVGSTNQFSPEG